jgi:GNAT superfamily N-acetyltransferase
VTSNTSNRAYARRELSAVLDDAAAGRFPSPDGAVTVLRQPSERDAGIISFTGHALIFADTDPGWIRSQLTPGDLSAPLDPRFLHALGEKLSRSAHIDMLTCASGLPGGPPDDIKLTELLADGGHQHPRVLRALRHRDEVRVWQADGGVVMIGRGVAARWEVAIEVDPQSRGSGLGRRLALAARHLVPAAAPLWAQIAPGNAASVRAFLHAGFRPVGAEALFSPLCRR